MGASIFQLGLHPLHRWEILAPMQRAHRVVNVENKGFVGV
jgi:hypothetical protein